MSARPLIGVYPPLAPSSVLRGPARPPAYPFDRPALHFTHLGRGAVWLALRALGLGPGKRVAMPAYHCGSEVEAVRLAGAEIDFYRVDASLQADPDDLARAAAGADAVYLISNFGFPLPAAPEGATVIADLAHALFSEVGESADATVFCPRKSLGVPDGGALLAQQTSDIGHQTSGAMVRSWASLALGRAALSRVGPARSLATRVLDRFSRTAAATREGTLTETVIGEWDLEVADMEAAAAAPARLTERIARAADAEAMRAARRRNYESLLGELHELVPEPFGTLPPGVAPIYLPVLVDDRDAALARLLEEGVRGFEIWPVPHPLLDRDRFKELEPLRKGLLALPVHQSLKDWHIESVKQAAKRALTSDV